MLAQPSMIKRSVLDGRERGLDRAGGDPGDRRIVTAGPAGYSCLSLDVRHKAAGRPAQGRA